MAHLEVHKIFKTIDLKGIFGYKNDYIPYLLYELPIYNGGHLLSFTHVANFLRYTLTKNVTHKDVLLKLFVDSLGNTKQEWVSILCQ